MLQQVSTEIYQTYFEYDGLCSVKFNVRTLVSGGLGLKDQDHTSLFFDICREPKEYFQSILYAPPF